MNLCEDRHQPEFQVTYKPAKGCSHRPVWLVCGNCLENKRHFGSEDLVESIVPLSEVAA